MPNLDNIHYKFFPKSKTAPFGKTLIKFAWGVEILVAIVGLSIAWMFYTGGISTGPIDDLVDEAQQRFQVEGVIVALAFIVVSIIELTKIPLATAFYYAGRIRWKFVFFLALLLINISTFETIIQGFELSYYQRSKDVDKVRQQLNEIKNEITQKDKGSVELRTNLQKTYDSILEEKSKLLEQKTNINKQKNLDIDALKNQSAIANPRIETLDKKIQYERKSIDQYKIYSAKQIQEKQNYILKLENKTFKGSLTLSRKKQQELNDKKIERVQNEILKLEEATNSEIIRKENNISALQREKDNLEGNVTRDISEKIKPIEENAKIDLDNINSLIEKKDKELEAVSSNLTAFDENTENYTKDLVLLKDACVKKADELEKVAAGNQTYRFAVRIKTFGMWASDWSFSKLLPWNWFEEDELISNDKTNSNQAIEKEKDVCGLIGTATLTEDDLNTAFWLWFGTLGFVISVTGTLIALAGLHLQDERMHEIRNRPIKMRIRKFLMRIAWIPVYINRLLVKGIVRLVKPKIVKEKVEVEVEKIVKEPVYHEKVVYKTVEVPKEFETLRKEMVYVPLPTDDEELLKKGPFKAPDYDKDKKK
jgi:hypothetical protein